MKDIFYQIWQWNKQFQEQFLQAGHPQEITTVCNSGYLPSYLNNNICVVVVVVTDEGDDEFDLIQPTLIQQLKNILDQYPDNGQILKVRGLVQLVSMLYYWGLIS